ncbi:MAG TPA: amidohydrolase family protein [Sedimentisphaerales bacterium]|nr:amidohydrolase family protein [Sedimentisphaerales bacterium]
MHKWLTVILALLVTSPAVAEPLLGEDAKTIPIFDVHVHYNEPAWGPFPPETVIALFDRNRIPIALVSSTPEAGTIRLWQLAPSRIVPELRPYYENWDSSNWMSNPDVSDYLTEHLAKHPHEGIGEFHVHTMDGANLDLLTSVAHEAVKRNIPLHVHSGAEPVRFLFNAAPDVTLIWAHAGMTAPPAEIDDMMDRYPRLYADTSIRNRDIISGRGLDPDWEALLIRHSDRFMIGTDTWVNSQWERYDQSITASRLWLSWLPKSVGEKIANGNAERLFKREATESLIGQQ